MDNRELIFSEIPDDVIQKWQNIADILADIIDVPAALIMKSYGEYMEVFISAHSEGNPYHPGDKEKRYGLYCETVISTQSKLRVPNATIDKLWDKNPDLKLGMMSYLGFPINYPDNQPFGTLCVLDRKENHFDDKHEKLMTLLKGAIEADLKLITSNIALRKLIKEKDLFISILAHDLRSPLSGLLGLADLLSTQLSNFSKDEIQKMTTTIYESASKTFLLIDELLTWMKAQTGKLPYNPTNMNLNWIKDETLTHLAAAAEAKNITIEVLFDKQLTVTGDEEMLKTVMRNLISNAIKFSYPGGIIRILAEQKKDFTEISVVDKGTGIDKEQVETLFDKRKSFSKYGTKGEKGTGLGLLICKEMMMRQNGSIRVESQPGNGSSFIISLPN